MARNLDTEIFKKSASLRRDFPVQQNFLAQTVSTVKVGLGQKCWSRHGPLVRQQRS